MNTQAFLGVEFTEGRILLQNGFFFTDILDIVTLFLKAYSISTVKKKAIICN